MGTLLTKTWPTGSCSGNPPPALPHIDYGQSPNPEHYQLVLVPQWVPRSYALTRYIPEGSLSCVQRCDQRHACQLRAFDGGAACDGAQHNSAKRQDRVMPVFHNVSLSDSALKLSRWSSYRRRHRTRRTNQLWTPPPPHMKLVIQNGKVTSGTQTQSNGVQFLLQAMQRHFHWPSKLSRTLARH